MYIYLDESKYKYKPKPEKIGDWFRVRHSKVYFFFGGFFFNNEDLEEILKIIRSLKEECFGYSDIKIKNNIYDYQNEYIKNYGPSFFNKIKRDMNKFRFSLLEELKKVNGLESIISIKHIFKDTDSLYVLPFINVMQRIAYEGKSSADFRHNVILDWNQRKRVNEYLKQYKSLYYEGKDATVGENPCTAGKLMELKFYPSIKFSITDEDEFLQVSDIIIGCWRYLLKNFSENNYNLKWESSINLLKGLLKIIKLKKEDIFSRRILLSEKNEEDLLYKFKEYINNFL